MKKGTIILFVILLSVHLTVNSQSIKDSTRNLTVDHAEYLKGDLTKLLQENIKYPFKALNDKIKGDVLLSFIIDANGKMDSLTIISSPSKILSVSSLVSFDNVENEWSPYKENGTPMSKKYMVVYKYRYYLDSSPPQYKKRADKFLVKQKYKKALNYYDTAIEDNQYDYTLFESRSKVKSNLGDDKGALSDVQKARRLKNEIIALVEVVTIGIKREKRVLRSKVETKTIRN